MIKTAAQILAEIEREHPDRTAEDRRVLRRVGRPRLYPENCTTPGCVKKSRARGRCEKCDEGYISKGVRRSPVPVPCQDPRCARPRQHVIAHEKRATWHRNTLRYTNTPDVLVWRDNEDPRPLRHIMPRRGYEDMHNTRLITAAMVWLVKERQRQGLSAKEVGSRIELSQSRTSEAEQLRGLTWTVVQRYAKALGYSFELDGRLVRRDIV